MLTIKVTVWLPGFEYRWNGFCAGAIVVVSPKSHSHALMLSEVETEMSLNCVALLLQTLVLLKSAIGLEWTITVSVTESLHPKLETVVNLAV